MVTNINTNTLNGVDLLALADKINEISPKADVRSVAFDASKDNLTFTFTVGEGKSAKEIAISIPDLDTPGEIDQNELEQLATKLAAEDVFGLTEEQAKSVTKMMGEIFSTPLPPSTGNVLFDLYALLALLLEAAQKQRDAARGIRSAQNQAIQQSIQHQADTQRSAALTGMIAAAAVCLIQVGMQIGTLAKSAAAGSDQVSAMNSANVGGTQKALMTAKTEYTAENAKLNQMQSIKSAQDNVAARQTEVEGRLQTVDKKQTALNELKNRTDPVATPEEIQTAQTELDAAKTELATSRSELTHAQDALVDAKKGYDGPVVTSDSIKTQEGLVETKSNKLMEAASEARQAQERLNADPEYHEAQMRQNKWQTIGGMIAGVGGAAQGIIQNIVQMVQAGATEEGAQQKQAEEAADQIKDLFMQAQDVVKALLGLLSAIMQAENESMNRAINA